MGPTRPPALFSVFLTTVFLLSACGGSEQTSPSDSASQDSASSNETPSSRDGRATGRVDSVSDNSITISAKEGPTNVALSKSTRIFRNSPALLTDISVGTCVDIAHRAAEPGSSQPPARRITITGTSDGRPCRQGSSATGMRGAVTSIEGPTVSVAYSPEAPTAVPVNEKTQYLRQAAVTAQDITQGACLTAVGTLEPGGTLQATTATVGMPPASGVCPGV